MPILPTECLLDRPTKEVVYDTLLKNEVPCYGCPKRHGCDARVDGGLEAAAALMGEDVADLIAEDGMMASCPRCGGFDTVEWATEPVRSRRAGAEDRPGKRLWACQGVGIGSGRQCNWSRVKYSGKALA